jgi:outer membrane protein assembly factor BamA
MVFLLATAQAHAEGFGEPRVHSISFEGLEQTEAATLEAEVLLRPGETFRAELFNQSLQNIRNLRIHQRVSGTVNPNPDGSLDVIIRIKEKQTLLPFFRVRQGGGSTLMVLGVGDLNTFGRAIELLPMYENFNRDYHGGRLDFRLPHITGHKMVLDGTGGFAPRIHTLRATDGTSQGSYFQQTLSLRTSLEWPLSDLTLLAAGVEVSRDRFSDEALSSGQQAANRRLGYAIPRDDTAVTPALRIDFGKINYADYRPSGILISLGTESPAAGHSQAQGDMTRLMAQVKTFSQPYESLDLATRFATKVRFGGTPLADCTLGGFGEARGLLDERFHGAACWYFNMEARQVLYRHPWAVLQPTLFVDTGRVANHVSALGDYSPSHDPLSTGAGIRVVFPALARLALRLDYAAYRRPSEQEASRLSLGSQQFF